MLIDFGTGQPYIPTPSYFLGCFDIYDREETLGEELEKFNPNDPSDREELILSIVWLENVPIDTAFYFISVWKRRLRIKTTTFSRFLSTTPEAYSSFPCGWDDMENTRAFFEDIYRLATIEWKEDLQKASLEESASW